MTGHRDQPDARSLLAECRRVLKDQLIPGTDGDVRYQLLMIASALGMAEREIATGAEFDTLLGSIPDALGLDDLTMLVSKLRDGSHDADRALYSMIVNASTASLAISKPSAIDQRRGLTRGD